jgi:NADH-quinone oxidoreductase subunit J
MLLGADFLALMVILVYGGAISILFLFIVMMLNLRLVEVYNVNLYYVPFYFFIIALLLAFYFFLFEYFHNTFNFFLWGLPHPTHSHNAMSLIRHKSSLSVLGVALYNYFFFYVFLGSLILFIAMIGAIYLTINENPKYKGKIVGEKYREPLNYWKAKKKKDS